MTIFVDSRINLIWGGVSPVEVVSQWLDTFDDGVIVSLSNNNSKSLKLDNSTGSICKNLDCFIFILFNYLTEYTDFFCLIKIKVSMLGSTENSFFFTSSRDISSLLPWPTDFSLAINLTFVESMDWSNHVNYLLKACKHNTHCLWLLKDWDLINLLC